MSPSWRVCTKCTFYEVCLVVFIHRQAGAVSESGGGSPAPAPSRAPSARAAHCSVEGTTGAGPAVWAGAAGARGPPQAPRHRNE